MTKIEIEVGEKLFEFSSLQQWVNKAQSWFANIGRPSGTYLCIAADGLVITRGKGFAEVERRGAFPVSVYAVNY